MHITRPFLSIIILSFWLDSFALVNDSSQPRFRIMIYKMDQTKVRGLLLNATDSSVILYPGSRKDWRNHERLKIDTVSFQEIERLELKKSYAVFKGLGIGAAIGITPLLVGLALGEEEGAAYATILTFPIAITTGTIVGATKKRKFNIMGKKENYNAFLKRRIVKYLPALKQ